MNLLQAYIDLNKPLYIVCGTLIYPRILYNESLFKYFLNMTAIVIPYWFP